jgi:hypothetical protein
MIDAFRFGLETNGAASARMFSSAARHQADRARLRGDVQSQPVGTRKSLNDDLAR